MTINNGRWTERAASDPRLATAARIGTLVLIVLIAPIAGWQILNIIDLGTRVTRIETAIEQTLSTYTVSDATRDFALRDAQISNLTISIQRLVVVMDIIQQRQGDRIPLFDQALKRLDRLEERVFEEPRPR